ncbi:MAG: hypothetical protein WC788_07135 [Candidatus Paceibacterota bacterium]|jgi:hypothetical protein
MEEKNNKTAYVVQKIKRNDGIQKAENMVFQPCVLCEEMVPVMTDKCECGGNLVHACRSSAKKEIIVKKKTEFVEIKNFAITQHSDDTIVYYFECEKCKELYFRKLRILK